MSNIHMLFSLSVVAEQLHTTNNLDIDTTPLALQHIVNTPNLPLEQYIPFVVLIEMNDLDVFLLLEIYTDHTNLMY